MSSPAGVLEAVAEWDGRGLVMVQVSGRVIGSWRPRRFWRLRRVGGRLERYDQRTPEWTRPLAERALEDGESHMPVRAKE